MRLLGYDDNDSSNGINYTIVDQFKSSDKKFSFEMTNEIYDLISSSNKFQFNFVSNVGDTGSITHNQSFVNIAKNPSISFPQGGEFLVIGETYTLSWNNGWANTGIQLWKDGNFITDIHGDVGSSTEFEWTIPSDTQVDDGYRIKIYDAGVGTQSFSSEVFDITGSSAFVRYYSVKE